MPPTTLLGLLLFLWLVTPGFLFTLLAARRRASAKESAFQETARVVFASVVFSSLGALAAWLTLDAFRTHVDLGRLIGGGRAYLSQQYRAIGIFLGLQIVAACALAVLGDVLMAQLTRRRTGQAPPRLAQESAWDRPLGRIPRDSRPLAWVRLSSSGIELRGIVAAFGHEIDVSERELVLRDPIEIRYPGQAMHPLVEKRLVVQGSDLEFLAVQYVSTEPPAKRSRQRRRRRVAPASEVASP